MTPLLRTNSIPPGEPTPALSLSNATSRVAQRRRGMHRFVLGAITALVAAVGLLNLWSSLLARGPGRAFLVHQVAHIPLTAMNGSRSLTALFGLGLLMLARSLYRRKKQAWHITVFLLALSPWLHLVKGLDWEEALLCVGLLMALLRYRRWFTAANDRPSAAQGARAALALWAFTLIYGPVGFFLLRPEYYPRATPVRAARQTFHLLTFTDPKPGLRPLTRRAQWFADSLPVISAFAVAYGAFMFLRPVLAHGVANDEERRRVRGLLATFGGPPLAYFGLLPDKRYLFEASDHPSWGIPYVVQGRHAIALGDPVGDPLHTPEAIAAFVEHCGHHDWVPAFYQVTPRFLDVYRELVGLRAVRVGEEAILDLTTFSLKGKAFQDLRTALNRMGREGIVCEEWRPCNDPSADLDVSGQLAEISIAWLLAHKGEEKTFAMGRYEPGCELYRDSRYFLARMADSGRVIGFVSFVPVYGVCGAMDGWNLDLMRRGENAPGGLMEFLLGSAAQTMQKEGARVLSLGLSPLSEDATGESDPAEDALLAKGRTLVFERFNQFYSFKGLYSFKAKFQPQWEPRYLIYSGNNNLAATIYAILNAHSPGSVLRNVRRKLMEKR